MITLRIIVFLLVLDVFILQLSMSQINVTILFFLLFLLLFHVLHVLIPHLVVKIVIYFVVLIVIIGLLL